MLIEQLRTHNWKKPNDYKHWRKYNLNFLHCQKCHLQLLVSINSPTQWAIRIPFEEWVVIGNNHNLAAKLKFYEHKTPLDCNSVTMIQSIK